MTSGDILHLQRLSTEDGPGIRTTVFFKGCPLQCAWCHNPESISRQHQVQWFSARCIGCKTCLSCCPDGCLSMTDVGIRIDRIRCQPCGICTDACPSGALEMIGKTVSVDELLTELSKDLVYYQKSGGGVTLSGGEPTLQCEFAEEILRRLNEMGIATALDTCGLTSTAALERLLPFTDYILYDIKTLDPNMHQQFTGVSNQKILANLIYIHNYLRKQNRINDLWIRTPLIPGATATKKNIQAIGAFLAENLDGTVARWELCAFNNLCRDQYLRLDMEWRYLATPLMTAHELKELEEIARQSFTNPQKVIATGATRLGE